MSSARPCPNCGGPASSAFSGYAWPIAPGGRTFSYRSCTACGLLYADPLPAPAELERYYAGQFDYDKYARRRRLKQWQAEARWRTVRQLVPRAAGQPARLLDVGCGHGWFLAAARREGWQVMGVDLPSPALDYAAHDLGLDTCAGAFEALDLSPGAHDLVTMWHSLEHMLCPSDALAQARRVLRPGGYLLVAVPNATGRGLARRGVSWVWLQQPFVHLWHFSPALLQAYMQREGFTVVHQATRDTWDANYLYDAVVNPSWTQHVVQPLAHWGARLVSPLSRDGRRVARGRISFYLDESARLLTYSAQRAVRAVRRTPDGGDGSELLILARRPD